MNSNATTGTTGTSNKPNGAESDLATTGGNLGSGGATATAKATGLAQTAQEYGQKVSEAASQAKDFVGDKVAVVSDKIKELKDVDFAEFAENAKQYARQNPGQAILISAGAGLLLGLILRGRR